MVERRRVPERSAVLRDEVIALTGGAAAAAGPHRLRRVEVDDPDKGGTLVFLTNHLTLGATTTALISSPPPGCTGKWNCEGTRVPQNTGVPPRISGSL